MKQSPPVTFALDSDRVGWITFDDPSARVNVFDAATESAFATALDAAAEAQPRAIVVISGKERIFIAGADLKVLAALPSEAAAAELSRRGQRLFQRLADSPVPIVTAIHGACAGGGFELALACHWRIATDDAATQIGLPETGIGTIPGWGGCVRLPRLIGVKPALDHILTAQLISAPVAHERGMIHDVVAASELKLRAKTVALRLAGEGNPLIPPPASCPADVIASLRADVRKRSGGHYPALLAAIDAVAEAAEQPWTEAFQIESRHFGKVTAGETCKNLIRVFFLREAAKKRTLAGWFEPAPATSSAAIHAFPIAVAKPIQRVVVIGAGVMGTGIAHWLAMRGFDVWLRDVQAEALERGMSVVRQLFDAAVTRGKLDLVHADRASRRITPTTGWEGFAECDLVIEAIVENTAAKQTLFRELETIVRPDTLLASNTSALPIEEIVAGTANPPRTLGIHFFNPVARMPLVELILGRATSPATAERAITFVKALGKTPVICRSSPGFLVTRVLFFYLNAAVRLWDRGVSTTQLDTALREFGWPMGPMRLIDEVGVDVSDFIFGELEHFFPNRFARSPSCARLLSAGLRGRKNGASRGFYRYEGKVENVNDLETRELVATDLPTRSEVGQSDAIPRDIASALMQVMAAEAQRCLDEGVIKSPDDVDFALLSGAGFPAFRGGLMQWARNNPPTPDQVE